MVDYDLLGSDPILEDAIKREGGAWGIDDARSFGRLITSEEVMDWGTQANEFTPRLETHDRFGERADRVDYHPAWHRLMELSVGEGLHSLPFEYPPGEGARVVRDTKFTMMAQVEAGHGCPISMTTAAHYTLDEVGYGTELLELLKSRHYDARPAPLTDKTGALAGMGLTERQGGSDVRTNLTEAIPAEDGYRITGDKWFMSAPMCDVFLILAQAPKGLSCFVMPRFSPDGSINRLRFQRLKDKLGNRSNASSEVEFDAAYAELVGEEGRGVATIIEMVNGTRLDCVVGSVGLMRQAVTQAGWHVTHRTAFGSALIDKPLMQNVMADLELEVEAATLLMMRLSGAFDRAPLDPGEADFKRIATPLIKYWVTKRCSEVVREAMECLGGNGYVEDSGLPRLYRESPVNAIWEGSGNVIALDLLRALSRQPGALERFLDECGGDGLGPDVEKVRAMVAESGEGEARRLATAMAKLLASSLMLRHAPPGAAELYTQSRLHEGGHELFGGLKSSAATVEVARRACPS